MLDIIVLLLQPVRLFNGIQAEGYNKFLKISHFTKIMSRNICDVTFSGHKEAKYGNKLWPYGNLRQLHVKCTKLCAV